MGAMEHQRRCDHKARTSRARETHLDAHHASRTSLFRVIDLATPLPFDAAFDGGDLGLVVRFGSRETGGARPDSDLDLAVLRRDGRRLTHRELGEWRLVLSDRFGLDADVVDLATADSLLRREVITHGCILHAHARDTWVEFVTRTLIDLDDLGPWLERCREGVRRAAKRHAGASPEVATPVSARSET
jgi:predicted nucleotidyltransferase